MKTMKYCRHEDPAVKYSNKRSVKTSGLPLWISVSRWLGIIIFWNVPRAENNNAGKRFCPKRPCHKFHLFKLPSVSGIQSAGPTRNYIVSGVGPPEKASTDGTKIQRERERALCSRTFSKCNLINFSSLFFNYRLLVKRVLAGWIRRTRPPV